LLVVAELTFLSIQLRMPGRAEPGFFKRHALTAAAVAISALGICVVAAVLSAAPLAGSLPLLASGVGAVFVMIVIVVMIVLRIEGRRE
jgi:cell division protein FtsW (lipid II flippase)